MPFRPKGSRFWHYDFQIRGRRFHGSCGTENFEEAKAVEAQKRVEAKTQAAIPKGIFTLAEVLGTYYAEISQHQPSAKVTLSQGKALVSVIGPNTRLPDLTMAMLQRHVSRRRATVANSTVNRELQMLGRAIRHMVKIHDAVAPDLDLKSLETKEAEERVRELSKDEQRRLFEHLREDLHPLAIMAMMIGARVAALAGLKWSDVDLEARTITMREKGGTIRRFPINNELRAFLSSLPRATTLPHSSYVLTYVNHKAKGQPRHRITPSGGLMAKWREALEAAGIEDFHFHDLRHTFATRILRQTGNLKLTSRLLGHKQIGTTMRYAHVLDDDLRQALDSYSVTERVPKKSPKRRTSN